jgi:hypothetical protein
MLKKLRAKLNRLRGKAQTKGQLLHQLQVQWKQNHDAAAKAFARFEAQTRKGTDLRREAKTLRKADKPQKAEEKLQEAVVHEQLAAKAKAHSDAEAHAAQQLVPKIKRLKREVDGLETDVASLEAQLKAAKQGGGVRIQGNKATGGTARKRLQVVALASAHACATGARHNFYSQTGDWDIDHCITGPAIGHRDDCSSWFTSVYKSCGLPDPNKSRYGSGYTGTLVAAGTPVSCEYARNNPGCAVIYGSGPGHHVEFSIGDGSENTVGHGSAPVDRGVFDLFGPSEPPRFFKFALS